MQTTKAGKTPTLVSCKRCGYLTYDETHVCSACQKLGKDGGGGGFRF